MGSKGGVGRSGGRDGPLFADGDEFETLGGRGGSPQLLEGFFRIECASCGTIMGVVSGDLKAAYCGECWEGIVRGDKPAAAECGPVDGDMEGSGEPGGAESEGTGGGMDTEGCVAERGEYGAVDGNGGGEGNGVESGAKDDDSTHTAAAAAGGGGGEEAARRLYRIVGDLEGEYGKPPTRRQVVEGMIEDGGGGAWKTERDAGLFIDNAASGIVYEPSPGRLSLIDKE